MSICRWCYEEEATTVDGLCQGCAESLHEKLTETEEFDLDEFLSNDQSFDFYDAWIFLNEHPIFMDLFECGLYTTVVKVNPETMEIDDDRSKNTKVQVWLEHGPYEKIDGEFPQPTHDFNLDCGADTFEEAIIKLAKLVKEHYNDDGTHK